jgi:hypothetical protein
MRKRVNKYSMNTHGGAEMAHHNISLATLGGSQVRGDMRSARVQTADALLQVAAARNIKPQ